MNRKQTEQRFLEFADQDGDGIVCAYKVLMDVYGFQRTRIGRYDCMSFDCREIGLRYFSGTVAVSRAFTRLAKRGLVERLIVFSPGQRSLIDTTPTREVTSVLKSVDL